MSNPNPPTARQGIRATQAQEQAQASAEDAKRASEAPAGGAPSAKQVAEGPKANEMSEEGTFNPKASQGEPEVDETAPSWKSFEGDEEAWAALDAERIAFLRESLAGYRNMLVGVRAKLRADLASGVLNGGLNPEGQILAAKSSLRDVRTGIAKCNVLLEELGDERPPVVP